MLSYNLNVENSPVRFQVSLLSAVVDSDVLWAAHFFQRLFLHNKALCPHPSLLACVMSEDIQGRCVKGQLKDDVCTWEVKVLTIVGSRVGLCRHETVWQHPFPSFVTAPWRTTFNSVTPGLVFSKLGCSGFLRDLKIKFAAISDVEKLEALDWVGWCCWMVRAVFLF